MPWQEQRQPLFDHLNQIRDDPSLLLDEELLETAGHWVPEAQLQDSQNVIMLIYSLLPTLQQDPAPLIRLLSKALEQWPLDAILALEPPIDFVTALQPAAMAFHGLTLDMLNKATSSSTQTLAATQPELFSALIELWLTTENEGDADKAGQVLANLLKVDVDGVSGMDSPVCRRIFRDKDVYTKLFTITNLKSDNDPTRGKREKTIAQARLLDWLPRVGAVAWTYITQSYHPEVEASFGLPDGQRTLLNYAAKYMVDIKGDVLMHATLVAFYEALLKLNPLRSLTSSPALQFLIRQGLHARTVNYYTRPDDPSHDSLDGSFIYGPAARYVARWAQVYPQSLDTPEHRDTVNLLVTKVRAGIDRRSVSSPSEDLHVLASVPRPLLVSLGPDSPTLLLKITYNNPEVLACLAAIFHGPLEEPVTFPARPPLANETAEIKAAHTLYSQYLAEERSLFGILVQYADTAALENQALASIQLLRALLTARWDGIATVLSDGIARAAIFPWLLAPPKMFSNLVGGRGDAENAAYKIAVAKFALSQVVASKLRGRDHESWYDPIAAAELHQRLREGPMGSPSQQVGARVATLEL